MLDKSQLFSSWKIYTKMAWCVQRNICVPEIERMLHYIVEQMHVRNRSKVIGEISLCHLSWHRRRLPNQSHSRQAANNPDGRYTLLTTDFEESCW